MTLRCWISELATQLGIRWCRARDRFWGAALDFYARHSGTLVRDTPTYTFRRK